LACNEFEHIFEQLALNLATGDSCDCIYVEVLKGLFNDELSKFPFELITLLRAVVPRSAVVKSNCVVAQNMINAMQYGEFALWIFGEMVKPGHQIDYLKAHEVSTKTPRSQNEAYF
jgi:hypothetical protein